MNALETPEIPNFLQLPTQILLNEFGAGKHKPGSGSAAALLGLLSCKMMQTVITVTLRNPGYANSHARLGYVSQTVSTRYEPFFSEAVQKDSLHFDRYHRAVLARRACTDGDEKRRLQDKCRTELIPATDLPLEIAENAIETAERGLLVYDIGAKHTRGDSGVAISSALSSCSSALFIVYLNLKQFRAGKWATGVRDKADRITQRFNILQREQFERVTKIQQEGVEGDQLELSFAATATATENLL